MNTVVHESSIHIDAPVRTVFQHIQNPQHWHDALPESHRKGNRVGDITRTPDGKITGYALMGDLGPFTLRMHLTREEEVPDRRIVDHSQSGPVYTYTLTPDATGTALGLRFAIRSTVPGMARLRDAITWSGGDGDIDVMLHHYKQAIENG